MTKVSENHQEDIRQGSGERTGLRTSDYAYELPPELIAQDPIPDRSASRLLVLSRESGRIEHRIFREIADFLRPNDLLILNDTKVLPARLYGRREGTGGAVEVLLLKRCGGDVWETLVRPGKSCRPGQRLVFGAGEPGGAASSGETSSESADFGVPLRGEVLEVVESGNRRIRFQYDGIFEEVLERLGEMPLPPYITHKLAPKDRDRYQTVYAREPGSAAAPTAGLHFTESLLGRIREKGVGIAYVTLHVGLGTFRPVKEESILDHRMHTEYCEVPEETAERIREVKQRRRAARTPEELERAGRVICVGTTSVRTLESMAEEDGTVRAGSRETDIFLYPGCVFRVVDGLVTNFHLPESTLIMLVSAFAGRERVLAAYEEAVRERYRFFSFGDAMLIL